MSDTKVTCPSCRGAREVMKLGGMIGKCNLCEGVGKINYADFPVIKPIVPVEDVSETVKRVGEAIPWTGNKDSKPVVAHEVQKPQPIQDTIKVERKKADIYKRKTTA